MKTNIKFTVTNVIHPKSRFIESISITGKELTVKFKNKRDLHHYKVTPKIKHVFLHESNAENFGKLYNQYLKGYSFSKTVYSENV